MPVPGGGPPFGVPPTGPVVHPQAHGSEGTQGGGPVEEEEEEPPYPLFPPGLIPGMVRKKQIGSGLPYAPMSPMDIPNSIPPSMLTETYLVKRVAKFFKTIGEKDPLADAVRDGEGAGKRLRDEGGEEGSRAGLGGFREGAGGGEEEDEDVAEGSIVPQGVGKRLSRTSHAHPVGVSSKGALDAADEGTMGLGMGGLGLGAGGGMPGLGLAMEVDPETGMLPDGSVAERPGFKGAGERLGLGAALDPSEATQYDDVYSSFRKSRSSNYHVAMSSRAAKKFEPSK